MKYKVGDRVKVKSLQWFNENSDDKYNVVLAGGWYFSKPMSILCGKELIIKKISHACNSSYYIMEDNTFIWTDEMIEGLVEEETKPEFKDEESKKEVIAWMPNGKLIAEKFNDSTTTIIIDKFKYSKISINSEFCDDKVELVISPDFELKQEDNKWFAVKKKEYPKTYEECCEILQYNKYLTVYPPFDADIPNYDALHLFDLLEALRKLRICRDAYWKITGEEMGLGKPWKPDWLDDDTKKYVITSTKVFETFGGLGYINYILTFPTAEMRDAFYENFKELIESCKELL